MWHARSAAAGPMVFTFVGRGSVASVRAVTTITRKIPAAHTSFPANCIPFPSVLQYEYYATL